MNKCSDLIHIKRGRYSGRRLVGYKVVKFDHGNIVSYWNMHNWVQGLNIAVGRGKDSFFHCYASPLDALSEYAGVNGCLSQNSYIICVEPVSEIVLGTDNHKPIVTIGAKKVKWSGNLYRPCKTNRLCNKFVWIIPQKRISQASNRVLTLLGMK